MLDKIKSFLATQLLVEEDQISLESDLRKDLGADSLDLFELAMSLEEDYDVSIPDEELKDIQTVSDIIKCLKANGIED